MYRSYCHQLFLSNKARVGGVYGQYTVAKGCSYTRGNVECLDTALSHGILAIYHKPPSNLFFSLLQVLCAVRKLQESGFYWGAVGGREASSLLRSQPPGTFLVRDSSDHHYFFTLSVQTARGTKNLRIHSQGGSFYLQPDSCCTHMPPRFDCGETVGSGTGSVYLIHSGGEKVPLELRRPLPSSLSSLQHLCRRTLNGHLGGSASPDTHQLPHTLRNFLEEYDAPI
uniref:Suppressor of cytokine signaling 3 n=1 Tax=Oncorhynchus kisutch TaxID=8019 RepID=A0A8C7HSK9_ONCKI